MKIWLYEIWDLLYTHLWHRRIWGRKLRERHYKLGKRDFPLGGDFDPDKPYREYCDDGPQP